MVDAADAAAKAARTTEEEKIRKEIREEEAQAAETAHNYIYNISDDPEATLDALYLPPFLVFDGELVGLPETSPGLLNRHNDCFINTMIHLLFSSKDHVNCIHNAVNNRTFPLNILRSLRDKMIQLHVQDVHEEQIKERERMLKQKRIFDVVCCLKNLFNWYFCYPNHTDQQAVLNFQLATRWLFVDDPIVRYNDGQGDPNEACYLLLNAMEYADIRVPFMTICERDIPDRSDTNLFLPIKNTKEPQDFANIINNERDNIGTVCMRPDDPKFALYFIQRNVQGNFKKIKTPVNLPNTLNFGLVTLNLLAYGSHHINHWYAMKRAHMKYENAADEFTYHFVFQRNMAATNWERISDMDVKAQTLEQMTTDMVENRKVTYVLYGE